MPGRVSIFFGQKVLKTSRRFLCLSRQQPAGLSRLPTSLLLAHPLHSRLWVVATTCAAHSRDQPVRQNPRNTHCLCPCVHPSTPCPGVCLTCEHLNWGLRWPLLLLVPTNPLPCAPTHHVQNSGAPHCQTGLSSCPHCGGRALTSHCSSMAHFLMPRCCHPVGLPLLNHRTPTPCSPAYLGAGAGCPSFPKTRHGAFLSPSSPRPPPGSRCASSMWRPWKGQTGKTAPPTAHAGHPRRFSSSLSQITSDFINMVLSAVLVFQTGHRRPSGRDCSSSPQDYQAQSGCSAGAFGRGGLPQAPAG